MTTRAPAALVALQGALEDAIASAVNSGIVGDTAHQREASKHNSIEDNPAGSWAVTGAHDAAPPGKWSRQFAAAFDTSMSRTDQTRVHNNLKKIFNDRSDPRRKYIAAFNGWDGIGNPGRYNLVTNTVTRADDSHKFHEHGETFYEFANDPRMTQAWLSAMLGESKEQYMADALTLTDATIAKIADAVAIRTWMKDGMISAPYPVRTPENDTWAAGSILHYGAGNAIDANGKLNTVLAEQTAQRSIIQTLADALKAGGGDIDTAAVLAKLDGLVQRIADLETQLAEARAALAERDQRLAAALKASGG